MAPRAWSSRRLRSRGRRSAATECRRRGTDHRRHGSKPRAPRGRRRSRPSRSSRAEGVFGSLALSGAREDMTNHCFRSGVFRCYDVAIRPGFFFLRPAVYLAALSFLRRQIAQPFSKFSVLSVSNGRSHRGLIFSADVGAFHAG